MTAEEPRALANDVRIPKSVRRALAKKRNEVLLQRQGIQAPPRPVVMLTLEGCVTLAAEYGFTHLTTGWFTNQIARKKLPSVVVARKRLMQKAILVDLLGRWSALANWR